MRDYMECHPHDIARQERAADAELDAAAETEAVLSPIQVTNLRLDEDGENGSYTMVSLWKMPKQWDRTRIDEWRDSRYPEEHCTHSYDCCGHYYGKRARWEWGPPQFNEHWSLILVTRTYNQNI